MKGIKSNKILVDGKPFDGYVYFEGGKIVRVTDQVLPCEEIFDRTDKYVSPGFIDLHTHGGGGHPFLTDTPEDVIAGAEFHLAHGTTSILPTVSAAEFSVMKRATESIRAARESGTCRAHIIGAHLEGPYLSAKQCGAQCPAFLTPPDPAEYLPFLEEYGDAVARWTYAPERDDGTFCRALSDRGIIPSIGHTNATYADVARAMQNGACLVTHLYSCTSTVTRDHGFRSLGVIESAFLEDGIKVEIIADGKHLPPELIRMIYKIKGVENVASVTDSLEIAGTDLVTGRMSGTEFIVEDGVCKLKDRSAFAGSIATSDRLLRTLVFDCGMPVGEAVRSLTEVPAGILGLKKGKILENYDADLVVFDDAIGTSDVFVSGEKAV